MLPSDEGELIDPPPQLPLICNSRDNLGGDDLGLSVYRQRRRRRTNSCTPSCRIPASLPVERFLLALHDILEKR